MLSQSLTSVPLCGVQMKSSLFLWFFPSYLLICNQTPAHRPPPSPYTVSAQLQAYIWYHAPYPSKLCSKGNYFSTLQATSEAVIFVLLLPSHSLPPPSIHAKSCSASIYSQPPGQGALSQLFFCFFWSGPCWPRCSLVPGGLLGVSGTVLAKGENCITTLLSEH